MAKKVVLALFVVMVIAGITNCDILGGGTGVKGMLILEPGQTGDVRNARVELYQNTDLSGEPVKVGQSSSEGTDQSEAEFSIEEVLAGYYYLLAWKDIDGDGDLSGGDLVGVYGGSYTPGEGGQQLTVEEGKMTDVGNITMTILVEEAAVEEASGVIENEGYSVKYTYTFNIDVNLTSLTITIPSVPSFDGGESGSKTGGQAYTTEDYIITDGEELYPIPTGTHNLRFQGTADGDPFDLSVDIAF
ncbi:hypothetical protein GF359_10325 [candidate division WOR-3 bacterium]|uniref:Uncharacterized protein n=1 Tax=candidate division WOR-3 bacterium TaxID=2052148 RepID=A0A9D5KAV0_UNCW3|nr:hypothetical protein [candidate division WOR-3 bacterium]MBD3365596.1 hypothetical protein [candidate division WOR-3 bacterium]